MDMLSTLYIKTVIMPVVFDIPPKRSAVTIQVPCPTALKFVAAPGEYTEPTLVLLLVQFTVKSPK